MSYTVFNEILSGKRPVTTEYALLLEAALGTSANIRLGLQADYNMQKIKQEHPISEVFAGFSDALRQFQKVSEEFLKSQRRIFKKSAKNF